MDESYQRAQLSFLLEGKALEFIEGLPKEKIATLEDMMAALTDRFQGPNARKDAKEALRAMKRRPQEKPEDYGQRIQRLARLGYPGDREQQEEEGVIAFKDGIRDDGRTAEGIVLTKLKTVQDCVDTVSEVEGFRHASGKTQPNVRLRPLEDEGQAGVQQQGRTKGSKGQSPAMTAGEQALWQKLTELTKAMSGLQQYVLGQPQQGPGQGPQQQDFRG